VNGRSQRFLGPQVLRSTCEVGLLTLNLRPSDFRPFPAVRVQSGRGDLGQGSVQFCQL